MNAAYVPVQLCRWQFSHKLCSRFSSSQVRFYTENGRFAFFQPPFYWRAGVSGATYADHLRLIGKREVDFLLVLIKLFPLGVTAEALYVRISNGSRSTQKCREGVASPPTFLFLRKWSFVWYKNLDIFFFHFVTTHNSRVWQTDRQLSPD